VLRGMEHAPRVPDLRDAGEGEHVVVVGGGLTAAQLVDQALERGAHPTLVTRRPLVPREFDVDPGWMGPKYLAEFDRVPDRSERVRRALEARGGGTVPPLVLEDLTSRVRCGSVRLVEGVAAVLAVESGGSWCVELVDGERLHADRVVAALGSRLEVREDPLLGPLVDTGLIPAEGPVPCLDDALRVHGTQIHVMGRHAIAELGPAAGNLSGARRAAERIRAHLCGDDPRAADRGVA
jgi:NADPH-dependent 2,4-dienoyl-CoA reductase/sulfur reductase-like enzyme